MCLNHMGSLGRITPRSRGVAETPQKRIRVSDGECRSGNPVRESVKRSIILET